jgi:(p)ppGpp synthase/HD superfamily hydrolase
MSKQPWTQETYHKAYWFAAQAHHGQVFQGTELPYIVHPTLVCMEVMAALEQEPEHDAELAIQCALLHDVIEDSDLTAEQLGDQFPPEVVKGVVALSKNPALPKDEQLRDSLNRIQQERPEVWMVKLADRIVNLRPPPAEWRAAKIAAYRQDAELIYTRLQQASPFLAQRLRDKIQAYPPTGGTPQAPV